jgi:hypothetical protein
MRILQKNLPNLFTEIKSSLEKSGNRTEYQLEINDQFIEFGKEISSKPLKFASAVLAHPGNVNQDWHSDCEEGERALIYLHDVDEFSGPVEFESGKVCGTKGTVIHYNASEIHRGCSTTKSRLVLALAFSDSDSEIQTIGGGVTATMISSTQGYFYNSTALSNTDSIVLLPIENYFYNNNFFPPSPIDRTAPFFLGATVTNEDNETRNYETSYDLDGGNLILKDQITGADDFWKDGRVNITFASPTKGFIVGYYNSESVPSSFYLSNILTGPQYTRKQDMLILVVFGILVFSLYFMFNMHKK